MEKLKIGAQIKNFSSSDKMAIQNKNKKFKILETALRGHE